MTRQCTIPCMTKISVQTTSTDVKIASDALIWSNLFLTVWWSRQWDYKSISVFLSQLLGEAMHKAQDEWKNLKCLNSRQGSLTAMISCHQQINLVLHTVREGEGIRWKASLCMLEKMLTIVDGPYTVTKRWCSRKPLICTGWDRRRYGQLICPITEASRTVWCYSIERKFCSQYAACCYHHQTWHWKKRLVFVWMIVLLSSFYLHLGIRAKHCQFSVGDV